MIKIIEKNQFFFWQNNFFIQLKSEVLCLVFCFKCYKNKNLINSPHSVICYCTFYWNLKQIEFEKSINREFSKKSKN